MTSPTTLAGKWTYRSFKSCPKNVAFDTLKYGEGNLSIDNTSFGVFTGELDLGTGARLMLKGTVSYGYPFIVHFRGTGAGEKAAGWIYDYIGFLVPEWVNEVEQRPAIIGTNIRTVPHDGQQAGYVASWIAVRQ
jgi:hypothetical protein